MPWVRLDEHMPEHPKVLHAGPLAAWFHVCALAYCNRNLTDGFVPWVARNRLADLDEEGGQHPEKLAEKLVGAGMWRWDEERRGWWVHDYLDYQPSGDEERAKRKQKQEAGRLGGLRSGQVRAGIEAEPEAPGSSKPEAGGSSTPPRVLDECLKPDPTRTEEQLLAPSNGAREGRLRDELWDAMVAAIGGAPETPSGRGAWNKARKELELAHAQPSDVAPRCEEYHRRFPGAQLTPNALAKHWSSLVPPNMPDVPEGWIS